MALGKAQWGYVTSELHGTGAEAPQGFKKTQVRTGRRSSHDRRHSCTASAGDAALLHGRGQKWLPN